MQCIYRAAGKVLVWLSDGEALKVQPGLHLVCQIASKFVAKKEQEHPSQMKDSHGHYPKAHYTWRDDHSSAPYTIRCQAEGFEFESLNPLCTPFECKRPTRLWVIQELVLSTAAEEHWGEGSVDFMLIGQAATYVLDDHKLDFVQYEEFDGLKKCYTIFGIWANLWTTLSFFDMLWLSRSFGLLTQETRFPACSALQPAILFRTMHPL